MTTAAEEVVVGICCSARKAGTLCVRALVQRLETQFLAERRVRLRLVVFADALAGRGGLTGAPVDQWPACDVLLAWHSTGFPLHKAMEYAALRQPRLVNDLHAQYWLQDRRRVRALLHTFGGVVMPPAVLAPAGCAKELGPDEQLRVAGDRPSSPVVGSSSPTCLRKPFVEKPVDADNHDVWLYHAASSGGGVTRLFRKSADRASTFHGPPAGADLRPNDQTFLYEQFVPIAGGWDLKVYATRARCWCAASAGACCACLATHAQLRRAPTVDRTVDRDPSTGKQKRLPATLSRQERDLVDQVLWLTGQRVCGMDLLRPEAGGAPSLVCDVNGMSNTHSVPWFDDVARVLADEALAVARARIDPSSVRRRAGGLPLRFSLRFRDAHSAGLPPPGCPRPARLGLALSGSESVQFEGALYAQLRAWSVDGANGALPPTFCQQLLLDEENVDGDDDGCSNGDDDINATNTIPTNDRRTDARDAHAGAPVHGAETKHRETDEQLRAELAAQRGVSPVEWHNVLHYQVLAAARVDRVPGSAMAASDRPQHTRLRDRDELARLRQLPRSLAQLNGDLPLIVASCRLPQRPLWRELATVLVAWMHAGRFPLLFFDPPWMADQAGFVDGDWARIRNAVEAELFKTRPVGGNVTFDAHALLCSLGVSGVRRLLRLRKTPGSLLHMLPPSARVLWRQFNRLHRRCHPGSALTAGGRAFTKHIQRPADGFWCDAAGLSCRPSPPSSPRSPALSESQQTILTNTSAAVASGNDLEKSRRAANALLRILQDVCWLNILALPGDLPCVEVRQRLGYGARWVYEDGQLSAPTFRGFLEPQYVDGHDIRWRTFRVEGEGKRSHQ